MFWATKCRLNLWGKGVSTFDELASAMPWAKTSASHNILGRSLREGLLDPEYIVGEPRSCPFPCICDNSGTLV